VVTELGPVLGISGRDLLVSVVSQLTLLTFTLGKGGFLLSEVIFLQLEEVALFFHFLSSCVVSFFEFVRFTGEMV